MRRVRSDAPLSYLMRIENEKAVYLLNRLEQAGYSALLVGGCVRDLVMGKAPSDYDIATSAAPKQVKAVFSDCRVVETGIKHGTVTVFAGDGFEVTTFRREGAYSDSRHPDEVAFADSFCEDASRRDFTINSLGLGLDGEIVDCFGGMADIQNRVIRCVGEPEKRFSEDALRILRALRFCSTLGFEIEENTERAMFSNRNLLAAVSGERVASELKKLLCGGNVRRVICSYADILGVSIPELLPMKGFEHHNPWHIHDVLTHTAVAVESCPDDWVVRLAALFHDIGKPEVFFLNDEGRGRFIGHAERSVAHAEEICDRLHLDSKNKARVSLLVKYHDTPFDEITDVQIKRYIAKLGEDGFYQLIALKLADCAAQSERAAYRRPLLNRVLERARGIVAAGECLSVSGLAVGGAQLIEIGFSEGPKIGEALGALLEEVLQGRLKNERGALVEYARYNLLK